MSIAGTHFVGELTPGGRGLDTNDLILRLQADEAGEFGLRTSELHDGLDG